MKIRKSGYPFLVSLEGDISTNRKLHVFKANAKKEDRETLYKFPVSDASNLLSLSKKASFALVALENLFDDYLGKKREELF